MTSMYSYDITLSSVTDRGYTSHEQLPSFGLINMNVPIKREQSQACLSYAEREAHRGEASTYGRVYDPMTMNFLSPDPFLQNPYNTQNYNRYSYCLNNPLKYTDPSGYNYSCYIDGLKISYNTFRNYMNWMSSEQKELFEKFEYTRDPNNRSDFNFTIQNDDKTNTYYSKHNNRNGFWVEWDGQQKIPDNELLSLGFKLNSNYTYARYAQFFEFDLFDFSNKINQNYSQGSFPSNTIEQEQTNNRIIDLNKENVKSLNIFGAILGSTVALAYVSGGAEVGTFVNRTLSVPAVAISVVLTYDTWADYSLNKNKKRGDLVQATFGTIITIVGIVSWPAAVPACIYGIIDANGNLNKLWRYFDE